MVALTHSTGCGMADRGEGFATLQRTLWGYARHPNFAGVLMIGLGCEVNQIDFLLEAYQLERGPLFQTMTMQDTGGTRKTVERATAMIEEMLPHANEIARQRVSAAELSVALQCGGSDAYSGITANPALGYATDLLVAQGGTGILAETPEIYGAEHLLTRRAVSEAVAKKLIERIQWWEDYTASNGGEMNNNPSPGNKAGGLTTILEKSLGAAAKGGTTNLTGVFKYAEPVTTKGFVFMDSPGYDPASVTGQVASGANIVVFTTGRGSCFGYKPAPSIKLATNTPMYRADGRGHGHQLRRHPRRWGDDREQGARDPRSPAQGRVGRAVEVRGVGHRRPRVHSLADRRRDVDAPAPARTVLQAVRARRGQRGARWRPISSASSRRSSSPMRSATARPWPPTRRLRSRPCAVPGPSSLG